jgi:hypothetical protein
MVTPFERVRKKRLGYWPCQGLHSSLHVEEEQDRALTRTLPNAHGTLHFRTRHSGNNQCDILSLCAIRLHFSVNRVAGVPNVQVFGVLFKLQLDVLYPVSTDMFVAIVPSIRQDADSRRGS